MKIANVRAKKGGDDLIFLCTTDRERKQAWIIHLLHTHTRMAKLSWQIELVTTPIPPHLETSSASLAFKSKDWEYLKVSYRGTLMYCMNSSEKTKCAGNQQISKLKRSIQNGLHWSSCFSLQLEVWGLMLSYQSQLRVHALNCFKTDIKYELTASAKQNTSP